MALPACFWNAVKRRPGTFWAQWMKGTNINSWEVTEGEGSENLLCKWLCLVFAMTREDVAENTTSVLLSPAVFQRGHLKTSCKSERSGDALMRWRLVLNKRWMALFPCKALGGRLGAGGDSRRGSGLSLDILANILKMLVEIDLIILVEGG